jgi:hypothetical protein
MVYAVVEGNFETLTVRAEEAVQPGSNGHGQGSYGKAVATRWL